MALLEGFRPQGEALVLLLIVYCSAIFWFFPVCRLANLMFYSRVKHSGKIISAPGESELKAPSRSDSIRIILGRDCFYCLNQYPETAQFSRTHCCRAGEVAELVLTEEEEKEEAPSDYPGRIKKPDHFQ